ncbi:MAG: restriction endonuclease subunit S [Planctomycetes bacterium]|nr:restriction endonuclease subunit S [Planctomycetota bacterium]
MKLSVNGNKEVPIAKFCRTGSGGTPARSKSARYYGGSIPWVKSGELRESVITETEESITKEGLRESAAKLLPANTLLVALYGATVGRIGILGIEAATNQAVCYIIPDETKADRRYLFHALQSKVPLWLSKRVGGGQPNISQGIIKDTSIFLPPLAEQKRIAGILDAADALRDKRCESLAQLDTLLQATFLNMFGDPAANPMGWKSKRLGDVLSLITYGLTVRPTYQTTGVPLVSASQIKSGYVDLNAAHKISPDDFDRLRTKCKPQHGDVLFSKTGAIGHSAILQECGRIALSQNVARLVFKEDQIHNLCGLYYLRTDYIQRMSQRRAKGNAQKDLQLGEMEVFPIYVPPLDLQRRFAFIVETVEQQKTQQLAHLAELDALFASLQHRAFRGEL